MKLRRLTGFIACLLGMVVTCAVVRADVIWEPDDAFYRAKYENCDYLGRSFTANGAGGTVTVWKEPGSKKEIATVENGNTFYVSFTYTDRKREVWGVVEFGYDENGRVKALYGGDAHTGWIRMADLVLIYDHISFDEEHKSEFRPYEGDYEAFMTGDAIVLWSYPCSGVTAGTISDIDKNFSFSHTYTDAEGRQWGFISYYLGNKNRWVCISDPANDAIPAVEVGTVPLIAPPSAEVDAATARMPGKSGFRVMALLTVLVAVLVIVTAILIRAFWKKK